MQEPIIDRVQCPDCGADIPNDGACWYCENRPGHNAKPITLNAGQLQLTADRGRTEFRARLVKAGRIRNADNSPGPFRIPAQVLAGAVDGGHFDGLAVFADHPGFFESPSVKALIGVTYDSAYNDDTEGVDATIRFYVDEETHGRDGRLASTIVDQLQMMLDDQAQGITPPDIGLSIVF